MATQQGAPSRPWFRLATMVRPPPPPIQQQQADQAPAPPSQRPAAFTTRAPPAAVAPPPPNANVGAPTSPPVARAPPTEPPPPSAVATSPPRAPTMTSVTSSPPSTTSHPPSPLILPSPQLKSYQPPQPEYYEQKTVLVQETKEKQPKLGLEEVDVGWRSHHNPKSHEDARMRILTIAGENKGAIMDLVTPTNKTHNNKFAAGNIKKKDINPTPTPSGDDVDKPSGSSNSDGSSWSKAKKNKNQKSKSSPLQMSSAVMNSNVQGVNNSILYNCTTTHHDPGVHLSLSRKPA